MPWSLAEIFTDKFATFHWLRRNGFETPETKTLCDDDADRLRAESSAWLDSLNSDSVDLTTIRNAGIIKPRDGAGCDGISLVPMKQRRFDQLRLSHAADDPWILQPVLRGTACSIGLIGGGSSSPTKVLLPAQQNLIIESGSLVYIGGQIPCDARVAEIVTAAGQQLADALGAFSGYLGADIVTRIRSWRTNGSCHRNQSATLHELRRLSSTLNWQSHEFGSGHSTRGDVEGGHLCLLDWLRQTSSDRLH